MAPSASQPLSAVSVAQPKLSSMPTATSMFTGLSSTTRILGRAAAGAIAVAEDTGARAPDIGTGFANSATGSTDTVRIGAGAAGVASATGSSLTSNQKVEPRL